MYLRTTLVISALAVFVSVPGPCGEAFGSQAGDYVACVFPAGFYGEYSMDVNKNYSLSHNQSGLLISYNFRRSNDYALGVAGPKAERDDVQALNATLVEALIRNDQNRYTEVFRPSDYEMPGRLTPEQARAGFDMFRGAFADCTDALVIGEAIYKGRRFFVVQPVCAGSNRSSSVVLGYEEYKPKKWRFARQVVGSRYAPVFVNALTGSPLDAKALQTDWDKDYVAIPLAEDRPETIPATQILLKAQDAHDTEIGKTVNAVLTAFLAATAAFPEDKQRPSEEDWSNIALTVTTRTLQTLREGYAKSMAQGAPPSQWKNTIVPTMGAWDGRRFLVDCKTLAFLLCVGDITPSVGCVCFVRGDAEKYRICNINVQADFMALFRDAKFCAKLREKLLLLPSQ